MGWKRLDPAVVARHLRAGFDHPVPGSQEAAADALAYLCEQLLSGRYVAVQDETGRTFVGTPAEAAEHMLAYDGTKHAGDRHDGTDQDQ